MQEGWITFNPVAAQSLKRYDGYAVPALLVGLAGGITIETPQRVLYQDSQVIMRDGIYRISNGVYEYVLPDNEWKLKDGQER